MTAPFFRRPAFQIALLATIALALLVAILEPRVLSLGRPAAVPFQPATPTRAAPLTYPDALSRATIRVEDAATLLRYQGEQWLPLERLAIMLAARARLTGSFDDYAAAQLVLDRAWAVSPKGAGPHLAQAQLAFSLHRLGRTTEMLDAIDRYAVPPETDTRAEVAAVRGDLAFYRGDYAGALRRYERNAGDGGDSGSAFRLAVFNGRTGKIDEALSQLNLLEKSSRFPNAQFLCSLALQRGGLELSRGAWDKAAAHFERADKVFPGYWLAQAHLAQMLALNGRRTEAIARYQAIAASSGAPEVMDALASVYRAEGDGVNARLWADRAGAIWARRVAQLPEAAWGHAVEHELAFGDPKRALDLAQRDFAARPYGASAVALAWALIANGRPADALRTLEPVQRSPWTSPEQHLAAAQAYLLLGRPDDADKAQQKALKLNPRATDPAGSMIWFGHG